MGDALQNPLRRGIPSSMSTLLEDYPAKIIKFVHEVPVFFFFFFFFQVAHILLTETQKLVKCNLFLIMRGY